MSKHIVFIESNLKGLDALKTAKEMGHRVSYIYSPKYANLYFVDRENPILKSIDRVVKTRDSFNSESLIQTLSNIQKEDSIDSVITLVDYCVQPLSIAAQNLNIPYTSVQSVINAKDKYLCREILKNQNIPSILFEKAKNIDELTLAVSGIGFPVVIKPVQSAGSLFSSIIENQKELEEYFQQYSESNEVNGVKLDDLVSGGLLVEEYMQGEMYSVDIGINNGQILILGTGERKRLETNEVIELGTTMPANISKDKRIEIEDYVKTVIKALDVNMGIFHVEIIYTKNGPRLLEVNPRMFGGNGPVLIGKSLGINVFEYLINIHLEKKCPPLPANSNNICVTSRVFASLEDFLVTKMPSMEWKKKYETDIISFSLNLKEGNKVQKIKSNFDYIGAFQVMGQTPEKTIETADSIIRELSDELGIKLSN